MSYIEVENLNYSVKRKNKKANQLFERVNLNLELNDFVTLIGANGSGKTTFTKLLIGMLQPDEGSILIDGKKVGDYERYEIGRRIGYLFQNPEIQLFNGTIKEELYFAAEFGAGINASVKKRYREVIDLLSLNKAIGTPIKHLSHGEKQRVAIGTVLMNDPKYIILDEPTIGLDQVRKEALKDVLVALFTKGIGILLVSHDDVFVDSLPTKILRLADRGIVYEK